MEVELLAGVEPFDASEPDEPDESDPELDPFASEPDEVKGNRLVAYVVLREGGALASLQSFCAAELPRYMQPARIEVRRELARTHSGKYDVRATAGQVAS